MAVFRSLLAPTNAENRTKRGRRWPPCDYRVHAQVRTSPAQAEAFDQALVAAAVVALQVAEQALALVDQLQQAAARMVILLVGLEVLGQLRDAGRQQRHLDLGRTGVVGRSAVIGNDLAGLFNRQGHADVPQKTKRT